VGRILDTDGNSPVPAAAVIATGTVTGGNTGNDGTVSFDAPANATSITVRRIGYLAETIPLTPGMDTYTIGLKKDVLSLETEVVTGVGGVGTASAFADAKVAAAQRAATTLVAADAIAASQSVGTHGAGSGGRSGEVRHAGDRTFVQRDSVWTDTRFHAGMRTVRVQAFSAAYFALLQAVPDLGSALAIGDRLVVAGRQVAVEVTPAGVDHLSDADVAAVAAGW
jgi:hypothetical protein